MINGGQGTGGNVNGTSSSNTGKFNGPDNRLNLPIGGVDLELEERALLLLRLPQLPDLKS